ncbi:type VII secretion target [Rhodococcus sp. NPDC047139]|uniref:type VII secretion target n=1 Tax=Rhodococcus sp. NPDC047139 TaxID=3155141 RepID=UPI0033DB8FC9
MTQPTLHVQPDDLRAAALHLRELTEQATSARRYAENWLTAPEIGGFVFLDVVERVNGLRSRLAALYEELAVVTDTAAEAVTESARMYEQELRAVSEQFARLDPDTTR